MLFSGSIVPNSFATLWTVACQAPLSLWFPGKNTKWVAISFSIGSSWSRDGTHISSTGTQVLYHWTSKEITYIWLYI